LFLFWILIYFIHFKMFCCIFFQSWSRNQNNVWPRMARDHRSSNHTARAIITRAPCSGGAPFQQGESDWLNGQEPIETLLGKVTEGAGKEPRGSDWMCWQPANSHSVCIVPGFY
jgi:hypothetical protein